MQKTKKHTNNLFCVFIPVVKKRNLVYMDLHLKIKALFICYSWDKSWIIMNIEDLKAKMRNRVCFLCPPQLSFNVYVCISSTSLYLIWAWRKPGSREPDLSKGERSIVLWLSPTGMYSIEHYSILSKTKQMGFFFFFF